MTRLPLALNRSVRRKTYALRALCWVLAGAAAASLAAAIHEMKVVAALSSILSLMLVMVVVSMSRR